MEVKPGYKQTEVGVIPEEWEVKRLGDVATFYKGKGLPKSALSESGAEPCIHYGELFTRYLETIREIYSRTRTSEGVFRSVANDVLMPTSDVTPRGLAKASCVRVDGVILGGDILVIRSETHRVHGPFLSLVIRYEETQVLQLVTGSTVYHLYGSDMKNFTFSMPPLPEQRAIATALSDVDGLLGGLDRLIAKKRDLKQAAMQQLLTGQTRLPGFHGEWTMNTVAELEEQKLVKLSRGQVISKKDIDNTPGDFPIYSSSIHNDGLFGRYGDFMFDEELITWSVDGGGNFFHRRKHKFSVTNVCGFMRVDASRIDYRFFAAELQLLHSRKSFDYQSKAHPSVVRKEYEVQLPPHPEQAAIAGVLREMDGELAVLEQRREKTRAIKQAMMQELLTGRTRLVSAESAYA